MRIAAEAVTLDAQGAIGGAPIALAPRPRVERHRTFDETRLRGALEQLLVSMSALHERGFVHRDLKPANVLVTPSGRVVVIDLGLVLGTTTMRSSTDAHVVGTVGYMAPEQASAETVGPAADDYAIGVMLFEALTGGLPFDGSMFEVLAAKISRNAPDPRELVADLPDDLASIAHALLARDPSARPSVDTVLGLLGSTSRSRPRPSSLARSASADEIFVGRHEERRGVLAAVEDGSERSRLVVVEGKPGTGKSAFLSCIARDLESRRPEALVLRGRCEERESVPYKALDSVLDGLSRWLKRRPENEVERVLPDGVEALAVAFPVLRRLPAIESRVGRTMPDRNELRIRVPSVLRELLGRIADQRPVVLLVDDFHFRDEDSAALFDELARSPESPPITIVVTRRLESRDDRGDDAMPGSARRLVLGPLDRADCEALHRHVRAGDDPGGAAEVSAMIAETEGHPAFVDHWLRHARPTDESGPHTLDELLGRLVGGLASDERELLDALAVAGGPISFDTLVDVTGQSPERCGRLVHALGTERLLRRESVGASARVEITHVRIRDLTLSRLPAERKSALHDALARSLEARGGAPEAIAHHWLAVGERAHAADAAAAAAERASSLLAFDRAARFYELALENAPAADPRRRTWKLERAHALAGLGRGAEAASAYRKTLPTDDPAETLEIRRLIVDNLLCGGHLVEGTREMRGLLADLGLRYPTTMIGALFAIVWLRIRVFLRGYAFVEREASEVPRDLLLLVDACWAVAKALAWIDPMRMQIFHSLGVLYALRAGEPYRLARCLPFERVLLYMERPNSTAVHASFEAKVDHLVAHTSTPHTKGLDELGRGWVAFQHGDLREVARTYASSEHIFRNECVGVPWETTISSAGRLLAMTFTGEYGGLLARAERLAAEAREHGNLFAEASVRGNVVAFARLLHGDTLGARRELDATLGLSLESLPMEVILRGALDARIDVYEGRPENAIAKLSALVALSKRTQIDRARLVRIHLASVEGAAVFAAAARGRVPVATARRHGRALVRKLRGVKGPWAEATAAHLQACLAKLDGDDARVRVCLASAIEKYDATGMQAHRTALRRALERLEGRDAAEENAWFRTRGIHDVDATCRMLGDSISDR